MTKGVPNKRYTSEFKQMVDRNHTKERLSYKEVMRQIELGYDPIIK